MTKDTLEEQREQRRIKVYREIKNIEHWENTLKTLRNFSRGYAVGCARDNNPVGSSYFNGRADGIEELIEKVNNSSKLNTL